MKRRFIELLGVLAAVGTLGLSGCGDDDAAADGGTDTDTDTDADAGTDTDADTDTDTDTGTDTDVNPACDTLVEGTNTGWDVGDTTPYDFILHLPDGATPDGSGNWPVIFNWHSLGMSASYEDSGVHVDANNSIMPAIVVVPDSNGFTMLTQDMTWDVFNVADGATGNMDVALFDSILECLDARYGVDETHVHSMGFSLGGIMTDLLATVRGDVIASVATYSGAYFSDQANVDALGMISSFVSWPAPTSDNMYGQLLCHGGTNDTFDLSVVTVHFDTFGGNDVTYLNDLGHDVVHCVNPGATQHGDFSGLPTPDGFVQFFADHPLGTADSPWAGGLPSSGFDLCTFEAKQ
jgi:dienelactone hydrolase